MTVAIGQQIGNYRVLRCIGTGGMGAVYLAEHPVIGKKVALKVIHRELASNREVIGRFYQEAQAVTRIGHPHIVEIHDFGQSPDGDHFFTMEYVEGKTLVQLLTLEPVLDATRVLHIAEQIADALHAAHLANIIHRDLKPDNVILCNREGDRYFVKLLDFGLAKMIEGGVGNLTAQGMVLGTPQYMSPEACEGRKDLDHRTDIYALGILLFQMMTGNVPFDGATMGEVLIQQVMRAPPAPRTLNPQISVAIEQIILRCLAKSPGQRFATMQALRDALLDPDRYLASTQTTPPEAVRAPGAVWRRVAIVGLTAIIAAGAVMAAVALSGGRTKGVASRKPIQMSAVEPRTVIIPADAAVAEIPIAPPTKRARITIISEPSGAAVFDHTGDRLGETPLLIDVAADGRQLILALRHPRAKPRTKTITANGDATVSVILELKARD